MLDKMKQLLSFDNIAKQQKQKQDLQRLIDETKNEEVTLSNTEENNFVGITIESDDDIELQSPDIVYSTEVVGYANRQIQYHFYSIIQNFIPIDHSIIEFGAGRGDFKTWHKVTFNTELDYVGIEKDEKLVNAGKEINGNDITLQCTDWKKIQKNLTKDWCINIGAFNKTYIESDDHLQYVKDTIDLMMAHSKRGVVISLTSDQIDLSQDDLDNGLQKFNAGDMLNWASEKYKLAAIDHVGAMQYGQFILIIYKEQ